jgi:uncharacterized membrane protein YdjX (TVP38/TMEM64 family)
LRIDRTQILIGLIVAVAVASLVLAAYFPREVVLQELESALTWTRAVYAMRPLPVLLGVGILYAVLAAISFPGMITATIVVGAAFGTVAAVAVTAIAGAVGCLGNFLATRYIFRESARSRWRKGLDRLDAELSVRPIGYLLLLRLLPIAPYYLVNVAAALSQRITAVHFFVATVVGTLPKNYIFASAGTAMTLTGNIEESLTFPLAVLAGLSLAIIIYSYVSRRRSPVIAVGEK